MTKHLDRELEKIKKQIFSLGALVEERVHMAVAATENRDALLARKIIETDYEVDELEVDIEEECLKVMALHQPVAVDLRLLIATIKINNDLERIGDEAVNIAERVEIICKRPPLNFSFDWAAMAERSRRMLKLSLDALFHLDIDLAFKVITLDDEVDAMRNMAYDSIKTAIIEKPDRVGYMINQLLISRHLERLADHATNIAEEVIYLIEGEIIRHGRHQA